ncbi:hypothetical protein K493DRAFT_339324 [Basidiobolus meristosporus CBS 931.73]|uniref:PPP4R2-domain-containing protein n=1 Tax=Basidiobolus meristosporus CBS 931.73 TaxID=1314790 RepID=A0A1Y1Y1J6_9FUNG|nr:hypothetical protein K493DRAFT_339324 [Basidiobolus meristosporus CBS 931.73]|eukprot:ORX91504.1 hypothetical protein K493DRAFT_339324 [Basidiobolus meristosporus CBS 931.73]
MADQLAQSNDPPANEGAAATNTTAREADEIDELIDRVVQSNVFDGPWNEIRTRLISRIEQNLHLLATEFNTEVTEEIRAYQGRIVKALEAFKSDPPFTVQRLCELIAYPKEHHKSLPKYMRALEKVVTVTSTYADFPLVANGDVDVTKNPPEEASGELVSMDSEDTTPGNVVEETNSHSTPTKGDDAEDSQPESTIEPPQNSTISANTGDDGTAVPADDIELLKRGDVSAATAGPVATNPLSNEQTPPEEDAPEPMESEAGAPGADSESMDTDEKEASTEQQEEMDTTT